MSFSLSWLAYKSEVDKRSVLDMLDLEETGDIEKIPTGTACFAALPNNWNMVCFEGFDSYARE